MVSNCTAPSRRSTPSTPARRSGAPSSPWARRNRRRASSAESDVVPVTNRSLWPVRARNGGVGHTSGVAPALIVLAVVVVVLLVLVPMILIVVTEYERAVFFRLGR